MRKKITNTYYDYIKEIKEREEEEKNNEAVKEKEVVPYAMINLKAMPAFKNYATGNLKPSTFALLNWLVSEMNFAGDNEYGGQTIKITAEVRELIYHELDLKERAVRKAFEELKEEEIVIKRSSTVYQINPLLFAKGSESRIKMLQCYILEKGIAGTKINPCMLTKEQREAQELYFKNKKEEKVQTEEPAEETSIADYIDDEQEEGKKQNIVEFKNKEERIPIVAEMRIGKTLQGFF